jgi:hypothetical protein
MFGVLRCEMSRIASYLKVVLLLLTVFLQCRGEEPRSALTSGLVVQKFPHAWSVHAAAAGVRYGVQQGRGILDFVFTRSRMSLLSENKHVFVARFICLE